MHVREYGDGQRAANVYNINANGLPYTLYIPVLAPRSPVPVTASQLSRSLAHGREPRRPCALALLRCTSQSPKYAGIIFMDVCKLMHQGGSWK